MLIWPDAHGFSYLIHCFRYQTVRYFEHLAAYSIIILYLVHWTKSARRELFSAAPGTGTGKIHHDATNEQGKHELSVAYKFLTFVVSIYGSCEWILLFFGLLAVYKNAARLSVVAAVLLLSVVCTGP